MDDFPKMLDEVWITAWVCYIRMKNNGLWFLRIDALVD